MPEIRIEVTVEERALVVTAAACSDMLGAVGFAREAVIAAARKRIAFAEAVERVCDRSRGVLDALADAGDEAPRVRAPRPEWPAVPSAAPLDEDEARLAGRWAAGSALAVFDQGALEDVVAEHALTDGLDVFDQAAGLLVGLARHAPFVRTNLRTAWTAALAFLGLSGLRLHRLRDEQAAARIVLDAAENLADRDEVARRLRAIWSAVPLAELDGEAAER